MVSATKIADRLPDLPDLPVDMAEMTDRLRGVTEAATETARQAATSVRRVTAGRPSGLRRMALPLLAVLGLAGLGFGVFMLVRSRRATADVGSASPAGTYART